MLFRTAALTALVVSSASTGGNGERMRLKTPGGGNLSECQWPGNGFPSGKPDFKLNLLGKMKDNDYNPQGNNNIVITLSEQCKGKNGDNCEVKANTKIELYNSDVDASCPDDYYILDPNGADGTAGLCLPDPFPVYSNPCIDGTEPSCFEEAIYAVYGRVRGKGDLQMGLCVEDDVLGTFCPTALLSLPKNRAADISQELLTVCVDADGDGVVDDGAGLFDCIGDTCDDESYYWTLDNFGVRNAEMRFFSIQKLVDACKGDSDCIDCISGVTRANACS